MKSTITFLLILSANWAICQKAEYVYKNPQDSSYHCYLTLIPEHMEIKGLIIRDYSRLPKAESNIPYPYKWKDLALENGLAIVYTVTSNFFPELYYDDAGLKLMDEMVDEVIRQHEIPKENIFIGGISASGTRALKYAQYCEQGKSKFGIKINGVFSVDSPLDFERFYYSAKNHKDNFKEGMLEEAELMAKVFPEQLGTTPDKAPEPYRTSSVFSYADSTGGNAKYLMHTATIFFHEPDMDWWKSERGADYYDINSFDIAGAYNWLKRNGHPDIELITTTEKGYDRDGNRKCHSWSIVDENYLINWMLKRVKPSPDKK